MSTASTLSLGTLVVYLTANASQYERALKSVDASTGATMEGIVRTAKYASAAVIGTLAAIGAASVREFAAFESSFAGVRKTVNATEIEFRNFQDQFRQLAMEIPISVNEINKIAEAAGQLGIQQKNIVGFTKVMADLGVATDLTSDQAATALAQFANITQMPQEQFSNLGSTIVALGNNLATTESKIVDMAMRIAGAGTQIGLTQPQIIGLAATMSSLGVEAEAGGTAMSMAMIKMAKSIATGSEELNTFAAVSGKTVEQLKVDFSKDAIGTITQFISGLKNMEKQGANTFVILEKLGLDGARMTDVLGRMAGAQNVMNKALDIAAKGWAENSALSEEAKKRYATFESQVIMLVNTFKDMLITIGGDLVPVLQTIMGLFKENGKETSNWKDTVQTLSNIIKTGLIVGIQVVGNVIAGWRLIANVAMMGIQKAVSSVMRSIVWLAEGAQSILNKAIDGANALRLLTNIKLGTNLEMLGKFDFAKQTKSTLEWADALDQGALESMTKVWEILNNDTPAKKFEDALAKNEAATRAAADASDKKVVADRAAAAEVAKVAANTAGAVTSTNALTYAIVNFRDMTKDPLQESFKNVKLFTDALRDGMKSGLVTVEQFKQATRDILSKDNPFIAPVEGMKSMTGMQGVDQFTQMDNEELMLKNSYARKDALMRDALSRMTENNAAEIEAKRTLNAMLLEADEAYLAQLESLQNQRTQLLLTTTQGIFENLTQIMQTGFGEQSGIYKAMFAASKAFAIAEATISISQGIAKAISLGWPAMIPAIAQVTAASAGLISNISSVMMSFKGGGHTGNAPRSGGLDGEGGFLAVLHPKERVIDETIENSDNVMSGGITVHLSQTFTGGVTKTDLLASEERTKKAAMLGVTDAISRGGSYRKAINR